MAELIRNYGGEPLIAPSMREIPLGENSAAIDFIGQLEAGKFDVLILLTGVGTRTLVAAVASQYSRERVAAALQQVTLVARGPKPVAALKELGLTPNISVPEPNTWRDILSELDSKADIRSRRIAVQEYGITNRELTAGLEARGAKVVRVPVYRWALPEDTAPLRAAIRRIVDRQVDMALFTNATQVDHMFHVAVEEKLDLSLGQAFSRVLIASIGPVCSEALEHFGLKADLEPEHPKMGHLMAALGRHGRELLEAKRGARKS
ncbi:MAG: uroporphyrinogen-III synthase [Deltaproteobacteria bacterium]|nr:uroporphyrinogen-III synthase [Deltaproteobacteria bacterium]MBI2209863.1 uroporphyrinogen-III synthase [Deltaproteobacteria bacterium]MBI2990802.1 uroporphyrinogen-III synthase [Deltaproteobacteria bacterium]